jgi:GAF domain-containing protein
MSPTRLLLTPEDRDAPERVRRLRRLGVGQRVEAAFDVFADRLAEAVPAPYAMVNFIGVERQFLAGLHMPDDRPLAPAADDGPGRRLPRDHGFCPHVVVRRKALVLDDVRDYPRFAGNAVVADTGIRAYLGAPLLDRTGLPLGTICVADLQPRRWGRTGLETVKSLAAELATRIEQREGAS